MYWGHEFGLSGSRDVSGQVTIRFTVGHLLLVVQLEPSLQTRISSEVSMQLRLPDDSMRVPWRQPHRRSGLATLPSVGAVPLSPHISVD